MKKITDFRHIKKYFCSECNKFHRKYYTRSGVKIEAKPFKEHKEHAVKLDSTELWNYQFKKSWRRDVDYQEKTNKPIGLPK